MELADLVDPKLREAMKELVEQGPEQMQQKIVGLMNKLDQTERWLVFSAVLMMFGIVHLDRDNVNMVLEHVRDHSHVVAHKLGVCDLLGVPCQPVVRKGVWWAEDEEE